MGSLWTSQLRSSTPPSDNMQPWHQIDAEIKQIFGQQRNKNVDFKLNFYAITSLITYKSQEKWESELQLKQLNNWKTNKINNSISSHILIV